MIKQIYLLAWVFAAGAALRSVLMGTFDTVSLVIFSLVALGLVHGLAIWSAIVNTGDLQPDIASVEQNFL